MLVLARDRVSPPHPLICFQSGFYFFSVLFLMKAAELQSVFRGFP